VRHAENVEAPEREVAQFDRSRSALVAGRS
jgi:hypothetical protein